MSDRVGRNPRPTTPPPPATPPSPRSRHLDDYVDAREHLAELEAVFDIRWQADMRAIKTWQKEHPDRKLVWPDHVDLVVWLVEQLDALAPGWDRGGNR